MTPLLSVNHISIRFGGLVAIADMHFSVDKGELVSLIGPNGAGKTTAFNVVTGFLAPASGEIRFDGKSLAGLKTYQIAELGIVRTFQKTSLFLACTALHNVVIGLHRKGRSQAWEILLGLPGARAEQRRFQEKAAEILEFVGLGGRGESLAGSLAYGEQRLLGLAVALAADPSLLLLDEPVSGMNPTETTNFIRLLDKVRQKGVTILLVEHDMRMVMEVSDRIVVLNQGKIIADGSAREVQQHPDVIHAYLGHGRRHA
ncbi:ABC transporter ATP-binding protein [Mesorhizobium sp. CO1-1-8]|uniref:ABC transporter ATP-binding protein n=1 Tax=Mesorhizobium sp. CO1-1-8 TaxID=2876631 RepID=UPI001CD135CA|nr:ABC transporter ATP-binding protein [Mesorhizobium sp. CO1-1-8]MBZ9772577.1 ABC transporter ATP-binding protein [Mesorhizobium sp. CO1-1-8]